MQIRESQIEALRASAGQQFEAEMVEHLATFAPELATVAGQPAVESAVRSGIENAKNYQFTNRGPVQLYLELMCSFGAGFDSDPQYPWARAALEDPKYPDQTRRASLLYRASMTYFDQVAGPNDIHARAALENARRAEMLEDHSSGPVPEKILAGFKACYPQKYSYVGEPALRSLISGAIDVSNKLGIRSDRHRALIAVVLFAFGHNAWNDPLYPWIGGALNDPLVADPEDRADRLRIRLRTYAGAILRTLG